VGRNDVHRPPDSGLSVVYADDDLLVLDKPAGLLSVPGRGDDKQDCLSRRVQHHYPDALVVHRLDMATSGLILMARGPAIQRALSQAFASREVSKRYVAVVDGTLAAPAQTWGTIDLPIAVDWPNRPRRVIDAVLGKPSMTRWSLHEDVSGTLASNTSPPSTRLELEPVTGRSHQLRVHLLAIGHAILGDALYANAEVQARSQRLLLHASRLTLTHPVTRQEVSFESPPEF
jgi:tRNA pseudouridine32 synthase/23S rRNA pseudouridine746 synthase